MARSECTSASESSKDWAGTSTRSLTPTSQLESCSEILRVFRERVQCQNGSTKRIPKRVRVNLSRISRTDEAAERCRLHGRRPLSLEAARDGALCDVFFGLFCSKQREFATKTCPKRRVWPPYRRGARAHRWARAHRSALTVRAHGHSTLTGVRLDIIIRQSTGPQAALVS